MSSKEIQDRVFLSVTKEIYTNQVGVDYIGLKAAHRHFARTGLRKGQPKETELCVEVNTCITYLAFKGVKQSYDIIVVIFEHIFHILFL